jgi:hypothetical protein
MRYVGQGYEVTVPLPAHGGADDISAAFEEVYVRKHGRIRADVAL